MSRSTHVLVFALLLLPGACAQPSQSSGVVTAPSVTTPAPSTPATPAASIAPPADPAASTSDAPPASTVPQAGPAASSGVAPQFRACQSDADCVAVPRAGCCDNGWHEAVAVTEKDAYAKANACTKPHPCPMYRVRETRVAKCDATTKLCTMVQP
jgi:hypothetical protein